MVINRVSRTKTPTLCAHSLAPTPKIYMTHVHCRAALAIFLCNLSAGQLCKHGWTHRMSEQKLSRMLHWQPATSTAWSILLIENSCNVKFSFRGKYKTFTSFDCNPQYTDLPPSSVESFIEYAPSTTALGCLPTRNCFSKVTQSEFRQINYPHIFHNYPIFISCLLVCQMLPYFIKMTMIQ